jgi:hypothetical protein
MSPAARKITIAGIFLFSSLLLYFSLYLLVRTPQFQKWILAEMERKTGYEIRISDLKLSPPLRFTVTSPMVLKSGGVIFQGEKIIVNLRPLTILSKRVHELTLERPVFRINLSDLLKPLEKTAMDFSIRALNIKDGTFVLEREGSEDLAIRSINLSARNLNLRGDSGVVIDAYIPWMDGDANVNIQRRGQVGEAEIQIRQRPAKSRTEVPQRKDQAPGNLECHFKLKERADEGYEIAASGRVQEFKVRTEKITGEFTSNLDLDAKATAIGLFFQSRLAQLPAKIGWMELPLPEGPVTVTIGGGYLVGRKVFTVQETKIVSPFASAEGKGEIALSEKQAILNATLRVHDISLNTFNPFFPKPLKRFGLSGMAAVDVHLSGPFNSLAIKGVVQSHEAKIQGDRLSLSRLSVRAPFEFVNSSFRAKGTRIEAKRITWGRKGELQFDAGEMSFVGDIEKKSDAPFKFGGQFQMSQGRFSTPDGSKVGEQLTLSGDFALADGTEESRIPFKGKVEIAGLELLWGKFFGDFKAERPVIEIDGVYMSDNDEVKMELMNLTLRSVGRIELKGAIRRLSNEPTFNLDVTASDLSPGGFYNFFIRDTFKKSYPLLGGLRIGGKSSLALRIQGSFREFASEGKLEWQAGEIREESDKWRIGPTQMALPFKFQYPHAVQKKEGERPQTASLMIQEAKLGPTMIPTIRTAFSFWNNSLQFAEPIHIPLYGGSVVVKDLVWTDLIGAPKNLSFSVAGEDIRLLELTEALGWYRFGGNLSGSIPQVQLIGNSLRSKGEVKLNVFDGHVLIKELEVQEPFSSLPSIKMDLRLNEINLERVSETFEFGRISGILEGTIEELVVTQGQAAQFGADLHTVERQGVSQWISVEALDKITVLSSGDEAGPIYGGLAKLVDFFRYSKLGFKAALRNDRLVLRGIESREGQEYLVVGTFLPPTVNIVSHTQAISFSELMRRLERVRLVEKAEPSIKKESP